jgi:hypothetical protein
MVSSAWMRTASTEAVYVAAKVRIAHAPRVTLRTVAVQVAMFPLVGGTGGAGTLGPL